jgi:hypothetical protein
MNHSNAFPAIQSRKQKFAARDLTRSAPAEVRTRLYLLSFLLTADRAKAELCSVAGLDMSFEDNAAIRDWKHSWARRIVINNALQIMVPHPETETHVADSGSSQ